MVCNTFAWAKNMHFSTGITLSQIDLVKNRLFYAESAILDMLMTK